MVFTYFHPDCIKTFTDSCTGAFVAAPIGGILWGFGAFLMRVSFQWIMGKVGGRRFGSFDRPAAFPSASMGAPEADSDEDHGPVGGVEVSPAKGKFF